jgi:hypothetical protein
MRLNMYISFILPDKPSSAAISTILKEHTLESLQLHPNTVPQA